MKRKWNYRKSDFWSKSQRWREKCNNGQHFLQ